MSRSRRLLQKSRIDRFVNAMQAIYAASQRGDIWDYLEKNVGLPHSVRTSRVKRDTSPWIIKPVRSIFSRRIREQTIVKPVQGSGTTIIDMLIQYIVAEAPGETWLNVQKKEAADMVAENRFLPLLKKNLKTARLLPADPSKIRKSEIVFDHMLFKVQGATANNLQSNSVPWVINDEVWLWKDIGLLEMARKRVTAVWNGSIVNVSQGSIEGDHLDMAFKDGSCNEWGFTCPKCQTFQMWKWFEWENEKKKKAKPGGVKWDHSMMRKDGSYEIARVLPTVRYECENPGCEFRFDDDMMTRRTLAGLGDYLATNEDRDPNKESWRWNAMTVYWIAWRDLFLEFVKATEAAKSGNVELLKLFIQQRLARFWQNREMQDAVSITYGGYSWLSFANGELVEDEDCRFMTVDFQKHCLWVCIRAWRKDQKGSRLLRFISVETFDDARKLQLQYRIPNIRTFLDIRWNTAEGARQCTRWQVTDPKNPKRVVDWGWTAVMGEDRDEYIYYPAGAGAGTKPVSRPFSEFHYSITEEGKKYRYILFSNLRIKDTLHGLRRGTGGPWEIPSDMENEDEYKEQINSEYRATLRAEKTGEKTRVRWLPVKKGIANHAWDVEVHQTLAACIVGLVKYVDLVIVEDGSEDAPRDVDALRDAK